MRKKIFKILGIIVGIILILFLVLCCLLAFYPQLFMGYESEDESDERNEIVGRINDYIERNAKLPESMSELGFEQIMAGYCIDKIRFRYINLQDGDYLVETFDNSKDFITSQYFSGNQRWENNPDKMEWFKLETNASELNSAKKIRDYNYKDASFDLDSVRRNDQIQIVISPDIILHPDSIAYLTVRYPDNKIRMKGRTAFDRYVMPDYTLGSEFGEWKYYDGQGNCYRKFWNYKRNGKLIYEVD